MEGRGTKEMEGRGTKELKDIEVITSSLEEWASEHDVFLVSRNVPIKEPTHNQAYVYGRLSHRLLGSIRFSANQWTYYRRPTEEELLELREALQAGKVDIVFKL